MKLKESAMRHVPMVCLLILSVSACNSTPPALGNTRWAPVQIGVVSVPAGSRATLEFMDGQRVSGNGGCNRYSGSAKVDDISLQFGELASTEMACADAGSMDRETQFFAALTATRRYRKDDGELVLLDEQGKMTVRLKPL